MKPTFDHTDAASSPMLTPMEEILTAMRLEEIQRASFEALRIPAEPDPHTRIGY